MSGLFGGKPPAPRSRMPMASTGAPAGSVTPAAPRVPSKLRAMGIAISGPDTRTGPAFPSISAILGERANAGTPAASDPFPPIGSPAPWEPPQVSGLTNEPASNGKSPELRAYDPSRRDRWARALIERGVPEETVEGLIGSRGLGRTDKNFGLGLVDFTPAGIPLATDEAERARQAGDYTDWGLNIISALPVLGAKLGVKAATEGFHYTFDQVADAIRHIGLRDGSYATPSGKLSPLQAHIDLALPPNRGLPGALVRIDLEGLRRDGYDIPAVTQVARMYGMPGGGFEMQFPYKIPPEYISIIRP